MVESHRVNGKPRQTVVATLGRLDTLLHGSADGRSDA
jgi:hypothetical protein